MPYLMGMETLPTTPQHSLNDHITCHHPNTQAVQAGEVWPAIKSAMDRPGARYMVWGSSLGWMVFYGALAAGWRAVGVELLSPLVQHAQHVAQQHGVTGGCSYSQHSVVM